MESPRYAGWSSYLFSRENQAPVLALLALARLHFMSVPIPFTPMKPRVRPAASQVERNEGDAVATSIC